MQLPDRFSDIGHVANVCSAPSRPSAAAESGWADIQQFRAIAFPSWLPGITQTTAGDVAPAPDERPGSARLRARLCWAGGALLAAAVLMACYLRIAGTVSVISDGAGNALQAWDMLHDNLLLHGWWVTDVSFYTTELPQYALVERLAGLRPEVVHICAAMTYTLLVLLAAFVARGRVGGAGAPSAR